MPTIQIDLTEVKRRYRAKKQLTDNVVFIARHNNDIITREINISEFDTWQKFAQWLINQEPEFLLLPDKEKNLSISFHQETLEGEIIKVLDDVTVLD